MERITEKSLPPFNYSLKDKSDVKPGSFGEYDCFFGHMMAVKRLGEYEDFLESKGLLLDVQDSTNRIETESHSEERIFKACTYLMQELYSSFLEYLDFKDVEWDEDEAPIFEMSNFHIVQRLFLEGTSHGGGTSTRCKCHELGIDDDGEVVFEPEEEGDEDAN